MPTAFLDRLGDIFSAMDREYTRAAGYYQFQCDGCMDNCCLTRFYHHTHLEFYYLGMGFENLESQKKSEILLKAEKVCRETAKADEKEIPVRFMCKILFRDRVAVPLMTAVQPNRTINSIGPLFIWKWQSWKTSLNRSPGLMVGLG
jgi:hypothetical protein